MIHLPFIKFGHEKANITVLKSPARGADRRKEPRFSTHGLAKVSAPCLPAPHAFIASVLDVSRSGMHLKLREPLEPGTWVQIETNTIVATGEVRHCRKDGEQYSLGVLLDEVADKKHTA